MTRQTVSFKPYGTSCLLAQEWNPRRSPCVRAIPHRTNLYPVGVFPVPSSLMRVREGEGLQGDGTNLDPRRVSAKPANGHTSTLDTCIPPASFAAGVSPLNWGSGLQDCTGWMTPVSR